MNKLASAADRVSNAAGNIISLDDILREITEAKSQVHVSQNTPMGGRLVGLNIIVSPTHRRTASYSFTPPSRGQWRQWPTNSMGWNTERLAYIRDRASNLVIWICNTIKLGVYGLNICKSFNLPIHLVAAIELYCFTSILYSVFPSLNPPVYSSFSL